MKINKIMILLSVFLPLLSVIMATGCGTANNVIPLPAPLLSNRTEMPFPYTEVFTNGTERWGLEWVAGVNIEAPSHLVLKATWTDRNGTKDIAVFPVNGVGVSPATGEIALGGKQYAAVSVNVNNPTFIDGWITLQEN